MDVAELQARIAAKTKPVATQAYRYARSEDLTVIRKPKNHKQRTGPAPWELRANAIKRWNAMDDADRAHELELRQRRAALEAAKHNPEPAQNIVAGHVLCIDCDAPLNPARLQAKPNAARCIECQQHHEKKHHKEQRNG